MLLYTFSVWLHILAAAYWIGGSLFLITVMLPTARQKLNEHDLATTLFQAGIRFRNTAWIGFIILLATGLYNLHARGLMLTSLFDGAVTSSLFLKLIRLKLLLFGAILLLSATHDFYIGPKATRYWRDAPNGEDTRRFRKIAGWMGRLNFVLTLTVLWLAVRLVRG